MFFRFGFRAKLNRNRLIKQWRWKPRENSLARHARKLEVISCVPYKYGKINVNDFFHVRLMCALFSSSRSSQYLSRWLPGEFCFICNLSTDLANFVREHFSFSYLQLCHVFHIRKLVRIIWGKLHLYHCGIGNSMLFFVEIYFADTSRLALVGIITRW